MSECKHKVCGQSEWQLDCPYCEIERLRHEATEMSDMLLRQVTTITDLLAENDALRVDADRYRWLRDVNDWPSTEVWNKIVNRTDSKEWDEAIDAAMRGEYE